ncbi:MAG: TrmJ/YjtD family RNA methyltransferase [Gemmatimonadota bacterium]
MNPLDYIRIVLVQPASPGNVGATARVLKNTGLSRLVLVDPGIWDTPEARWRAHGSGEILDSLQTRGSLAAATADAHLVIGTTHRLGRFREVEDDYVGVLREAVALAGPNQVAIVFGREKDGLWHDEIEQCHRLIRIPSAVPYPSFNLSHAVLLVAYELFRAADQAARQAPPCLATAAELASVCDHILAAMATIGFRPYNDDPTNFRRVVRRVLSRTPLERRDANVLHRVCVQIEKFAQLREGAGGDAPAGKA